MYNPVCMPSDIAFQSNFNLSVAEIPFTNTGFILWAISYITLYSIVEDSIIYLFDKYEDDKHDAFMNKLKLKKQPLLYITNDDLIADSTKLEILNRINKDLLFRSAILHYIFRIQGDFPSKYPLNTLLNIDVATDVATDVNNELLFINAYDEYIFWRDIYGGEQYFNLDETLPNDIRYIINDVDFEANHAHIRFISWVYYSGIYDYLTDPHNYKRVLDSMYHNRELYGREFLEYHLYCNDYDAKYIDSNRVIYYDNDDADDADDDASLDGSHILEDDSDMDSESDNQYSKLLDKLDISNVVEQIENVVYNIGRRFYCNCSRLFNRINENIENNLEIFKVR
jgi:hypothetical protein